MLGDRALAYKEKSVRPNALEEGDVVDVDGRNLVVLSMEKRDFVTDGDDSEVFAAIKAAGERDKVSKHFDEKVVVTFGSVEFSADGKASAKEVVRHYTEWDLVTVFV